MDRQTEKDQAVGFDYQNGVDPKPYNQINRSHLDVPKPTNHEAKITHADKVMKAVLEAK